MIVSLIATVDIGNNIIINTYKQNIKEDQDYFEKMTIGTGSNAIIMDLNTWISISSSKDSQTGTILKYNPLENRLNIIISKTNAPEPAYYDEEYVYDYCHCVSGYCNCLEDMKESHSEYKKSVKTIRNLDQALSHCKHNNISEVFIIGGSLFQEALSKKLCTNLYITHTNKLYKFEQDQDIYYRDPYFQDPCKLLFPNIDLSKMYKCIKTENIQVKYTGDPTMSHLYKNNPTILSRDHFILDQDPEDPEDPRDL
jgi:dihydrofolate reductase